jgi:hypothetical protein
VGEGQKVAVGRIVGRTIATTVRSLLLFVGLGIIAYAAVRASMLVGRRLLPFAGFHGATDWSGRMTVTLLTLLGLRIIAVPAAVIRALAGAMIVHRAVALWRGAALSLRADAAAAGRAFWAVAGIALVWIVLGVLPYLPDWFRKPPITFIDYPNWMPKWLQSVIYEYVLWHPFITIGSIVLLIAGILWCLAIPVAVVEGCGPIASLRRSMQLTKGHRLRIFGLWLLYTAFSVGATAGCNFLIATDAPAMPHPRWSLLASSVPWLLPFILMAVGTAAIYAEARRIEVATSPSSATAPQPTGQPSLRS